MIGGDFALAAPPEGKGWKKDDGGGDDGSEETVLPNIEYTIYNFAPPIPTNYVEVYDFSNSGMAVDGFGQLAGTETLESGDGTTTRIFFVLTPVETIP